LLLIVTHFQATDMWIQDIPSEEENDEEIIDVTSALQLLVVNSYVIHKFFRLFWCRRRLNLPGGLSKSSFNGIYNPSPSTENYIEIFYEFQHKRHRVVALDLDENELVLPQSSMLPPDSENFRVLILRSSTATKCQLMSGAIEIELTEERF
jgi:hypothetical protein